MTEREPDWDTVMETEAESRRDHFRATCGDRHRWAPHEHHAEEGYRCADCGITEAELDAETYGRAYVEGDPF